MRAALALALLLLAAPSNAQEPVAHAEAHSGSEGYPRLHVIGFADVNFFATDEDIAAPTSGFLQGQFILHFTSQLGERLTFLAETSLSARRDAATSAAAHGYNAEVERAILKYSQSDALKLSVGRYHTPISYWNVAVHHGQWLQTTVSRPEMIQFGGQFLPVHFVGVLGEGSASVGRWTVEYNAGLGNGRSSVISRGGDAGDVNDGRALVGGLSVRPDRPFGAQAGLSVYRDLVTLPPVGARARELREWILAGHLVLTKERPEILAEFAQVWHTDRRTNRTTRSGAWYVQVAYRLEGGGSRWKPYGRWEEVGVAAADEAYAALADRRGFLLGVRFDPADLVALKAEYRRQRTAERPYVDALFTQVAFTF